MSNSDREFQRLCGIVTHLLCEHEYEKIQLLYNELLKEEVIRPIECLDSTDDHWESLLMFKFLIAFDKMKHHKSNK